MSVLLWVVVGGLVLNSWMSWANWHSARKNREFMETYLREKYGPEWRHVLDSSDP